MVSITKVRSEADLATVKSLIFEFIDWLHERYPDMRSEIEYYFSNQGFDTEMADILATFGPPSGECLLARIHGEPAGILMFKAHGEGECEMNRMFVRADMRRKGVGEALGHALIKAAREAGYSQMLLAALDKHHEALPLYEKLGFTYETRESESGNLERERHMRCLL